MEKMHAIYTDNPSLGDVNVVSQSLDVCQRRIDELGVELDKFKVPVVLCIVVTLASCLVGYSRQLAS